MSRSNDLDDAVAGVVEVAATASFVVLVEGLSDQVALETLAGRRDRDLHLERVRIVPMGGATSIGHFLHALVSRGSDVTLAGLCDLAEEPSYRRALEGAGYGTDLTRAEMESLGFFVCDEDLEDELIRSLGTATVEAVIAAEGELKSFRRLQRQPAQRDRAHTAQLRRFMGSKSGRKARYARALVEAMDLSHVPPPLEGVLAAVLA